jgi:hypothetical protein
MICRSRGTVATARDRKTRARERRGPFKTIPPVSEEPADGDDQRHAQHTGMRTDPLLLAGVPHTHEQDIGLRVVDHANEVGRLRLDEEPVMTPRKG